VSQPTIKPQPGPQEDCLKSSGDIVIFGGAAGGGKSFALLMEALRHVRNPKFGAVIFRRTHKQITDEGGLWDKSGELYPLVGGKPYGKTQWLFPSGAKITFSHLQHEKDKYSWDGSQVPLIMFDELIHFSESTFWYLQTRNRSTSGVKPYIRCTCNPDAESWVADLIAWWIDQETGFPIPERSGKLRWFYRVDGKLVWGDSKQEMLERYPDMAADGIEAQSLTFIGSKLSDNKILLAADPGYRAKLMSQPLVEQERLLKGNWKIRPAAGLKFPRTKWKLVDTLPEGVEAWVRFWDKAATEGGTGARTAGVLMGRLKQAAAEQMGYRFIIANAVADRWGDAEREAQIKATAEMDRATYGHVSTGMEQEPGSGGKHSTWATVTALAGFDAYAERATTNKAARWNPMAAQQQVGNIAVLKNGDWDWADFIRELDALAGDEALDKSKLKDQADAASGAFKGLTQRGNTVAGDILASGARDEDDRTKLTDEELDDPDTPDFIRDLLQSYREDKGGYGGDR
jgi:predicted phage terminase large subunit-like protein